jgi:glycosyltransferase involved in cell wall biosynthesis
MISAVILTKNEEQNIQKCLESVKWCDEIVIIDDESSDATVEIAKKYKAGIYVNPLNGDFSSQRNFGLTKTKYDWVLFVDSDEVVSDALAYEISNAIGLKGQNLKKFNGYYIRRVDFMWGKKLLYGDTNIRILRLSRKDLGIWQGMAHETWKVKEPVGSLVNPLLHFPHRNLEEFLKEINFYTDIRSKELNGKKVKVSFWTILSYPLGKFVVNYILKKGFRDGIRGLIFATIMSFHSFLVRGKLWLMNNK